MNIRGGVSIVTGSSSGVGAALALKLADLGSNVVINYSRSEAAALEVAKQCEAKGVETLVVKANVAEDTACREMADAAMEKWGRIDALVNNAGTTKFVDHRDLDGLDAQDFQDIYAVNVIGAYQMTRAVVPHMRTTGRGSIVNVASIAAVTGVGSCVAYTASKGALVTMTLSHARALGPEVRVNAVCPGFIAGEWLKQGLGEETYNAQLEFLTAAAPCARSPRRKRWPMGFFTLLPVPISSPAKRYS
ncbi:SDR family NAD(P)-dependent oxidoreductase [Alkalilimnicola ehrlichii]|uniref:SDR family NAD(P)-dependent oxidoreductase n=1 Tax=Alkalilimnicola ehrlichii TaxID=351052 RepID=UPI001C6E807E|nr:SDR family NAD(P)-dependent oxidoreductase [Alkalilimnicola ehrlichii]